MARTGTLTIADIERLSARSQLDKVLYVLRRWPVFPMFIIVVLVISAVFAPSVAPNEPEKQDLRARTSASEATKALREGEIQRAEIWLVYRLRKP